MPPLPSSIFADEPFVPARGLSNGHVITFYAWARARTRSYPGLPAPDTRLIRSDEDTQVRADCYWQADRHAHSTLLCMHGLEGSSEGHYMRGLAHYYLGQCEQSWNLLQESLPMAQTLPEYAAVFPASVRPFRYAR